MRVDMWSYGHDCSESNGLDPICLVVTGGLACKVSLLVCKQTNCQTMSNRTNGGQANKSLKGHEVSTAETKLQVKLPMATARGTAEC